MLDAMLFTVLDDMLTSHAGNLFALQLEGLNWCRDPDGSGVYSGRGECNRISCWKLYK